MWTLCPLLPLPSLDGVLDVYHLFFCTVCAYANSEGSLSFTACVFFVRLAFVCLSFLSSPLRLLSFYFSNSPFTLHSLSYFSITHLAFIFFFIHFISFHSFRSSFPFIFDHLTQTTVNFSPSCTLFPEPLSHTSHCPREPFPFFSFPQQHTNRHVPSPPSPSITNNMSNPAFTATLLISPGGTLLTNAELAQQQQWIQVHLTRRMVSWHYLHNCFRGGVVFCNTALISAEDMRSAWTEEKMHRR